MKINRSLILLAALALAASLSLSGCKSQTAQPASQTAQSSSPQQPSAAQPSGQPSAQPNSQPDGGSGANLAPAGPQAPQAPPPPAVIVLPASTEIRVRTRSGPGIEDFAAWRLLQRHRGRQRRC